MAGVVDDIAVSLVVFVAAGDDDGVSAVGCASRDSGLEGAMDAGVVQCASVCEQRSFRD